MRALVGPSVSALGVSSCLGCFAGIRSSSGPRVGGDASVTTPPSVTSGGIGAVTGGAKSDIGEGVAGGSSSATAPNRASLSSPAPGSGSGFGRREYFASDSPGKTSVGPAAYGRSVGLASYDLVSKEGIL